MKTGTTTAAAPRPAPETTRPCQIPGCLGWTTTRELVDGVAVLSIFCAHHTVLRFAAVWALDPCQRFEALTGSTCVCLPGEPSCTPCMAIRAYYLPVALAGCVARSSELEALRSLGPTVQGIEPHPGGPVARAVRAPGANIVHGVREHARMAATGRRTGLSTG